MSWRSLTARALCALLVGWGLLYIVDGFNYQSFRVRLVEVSYAVCMKERRSEGRVAPSVILIVVITIAGAVYKLQNALTNFLAKMCGTLLHFLQNLWNINSSLLLPHPCNVEWLFPMNNASHTTTLNGGGCQKDIFIQTNGILYSEWDGSNRSWRTTWQTVSPWLGLGEN